jgi:hypothetical protein
MDFWMSTLSNITATAVGGLFAALIGLFTRKSRWQAPAGDREDRVSDRPGQTGSSRDRTGQGVRTVNAKNGDGAQVAVAGDVDGNISIDTSSTVTIQKNINQSSPQTATTEDGWGRMAGILAVALVSTALFLVIRPLLMWFVVGTSVGLAITFAVAVLRTFEARAWNGHTLMAAIEVIAALGVTTVAWISVFTQSWHGNSIETISQRVDSAASSQPVPKNSVVAVFEFVAGRALELAQLDFPHGLIVAILMAGTALLSICVLFLSWSTLFDWCSYLGFDRGSAGARLRRRAERLQSKGWKEFCGNLLLSGIIVALACGLPFMYFDAIKA